MRKVIAKMKLQFVALATAFATLAVTTRPFPGWDSLIQHSPEIIVARCTQTPDPHTVDKNGFETVFKDGVVPSNVDVVSVLKGETHVTATYLHSWVLPRQGEYYLIFSVSQHPLYGFYQAIEPYRVVPLGPSFSTNSIPGKPLSEQVRTLLQQRLQNLNEQVRMLLQARLQKLNEQMKQEQEEKQRLEEGLRQ